MKNVIDTNPFITACVSEDYKKKIIRYLQDHNSLMILTIYNEIKDKLLMLHTGLIGFENISIKGNKKALLALPMFKSIKESSEEVYNFINNAGNPREVQISIGILLSKINKLPKYPNNDFKKSEIIQTQKRILKLPKIKENDLNHLYLMYDYSQNFASLVNFYTEDKKDYLTNKEEIEKTLKDIKIKPFSEF